MSKYSEQNENVKPTLSYSEVRIRPTFPYFLVIKFYETYSEFVAVYSLTLFDIKFLVISYANHKLYVNVNEKMAANTK